MEFQFRPFGIGFVLTHEERLAYIAKVKEKYASVVLAGKSASKKIVSVVKPVALVVTKEVLAKTSLGLYHTANALGTAGKKTAELYDQVVTKEESDKVVDWMGKEVTDLYDQAIAATVYLNDVKH